MKPTEREKRCAENFAYLIRHHVMADLSLEESIRAIRLFHKHRDIYVLGTEFESAGPYIYHNSVGQEVAQSLQEGNLLLNHPAVSEGYKKRIRKWMPTAPRKAKQ